MNRLGKKMAIISFGCFAMAIATHFFMGPHALATGGATGIAVILQQLFPQIALGTYLTVVNAIFFIIGFIVIGKQFGLLTLYGSAFYSLATMALERIFPISQPLTKDPLVSLIFGSMLTSFGLALAFMQNASTGGTDIVAKILHTKWKIPLNRGMFFIDVLVVIASAYAISIEKSLYAIIGIYLQSMLMGNMIAGADRRIVMTILSKKVSEINRFIHIDIDRGSTIYPALGGYSSSEYQVIVTVVHSREYVRIKDYVETVDPTAFVYIYQAHEVMGEGFTFSMKDRKDLV